MALICSSPLTLPQTPLKTHANPHLKVIESSFPGPLILHSYLIPATSQTRSRNSTAVSGILETAREGLRPLSSSTSASEPHPTESQVNGTNGGSEEEEEEGSEATNTTNVPPLLIGTVVARTADNGGDARRSAARLERVGRGFQREWTQAQQREEGDKVGEEGEG